MRQFVGSVALALVVGATLTPVEVAGAPPQTPLDVAGKWTVTWSCSIRRNADGTVKVLRTCTSALMLEQTGTELSGKWKGVFGLQPIRGAVVEGQIRFATAPREVEGRTVVLRFVGELHDGELSLRTVQRRAPFEQPDAPIQTLRPIDRSSHMKPTA